MHICDCGAAIEVGQHCCPLCGAAEQITQAEVAQEPALLQEPEVAPEPALGQEPEVAPDRRAAPRLYTLAEAAAELALGGRASVQRRMRSLAKRGEALSVEAGDLQTVGARRLLTEQGLGKLRAFRPAPTGRPRGSSRLHSRG